MGATIPTTQSKQAWSNYAIAQSECETFPTGARSFGIPTRLFLFWEAVVA
jgi:hypothetical protein